VKGFVYTRGKGHNNDEGVAEECVEGIRTAFNSVCTAGLSLHILFLPWVGRAVIVYPSPKLQT